MNTLSKPEKELTAVAPIVRVKNPDEIEKQINSEICDEYECDLLRIDLGIMRADYDNWEGIFKETLLRVRPEIIMWEKAMEIVLKLMEDSDVEANANNDGNGFYVTVSYKPTEFVYIKVNTKDDLRCFTLPKALDWIQQKLIDLKTSVRKIENDQQYVNAQRDKINSIETCLMKKEAFLAKKPITMEKINRKKDNLVQESDPLSETRKDFENEFKEFMSEVEKDNALLSHLTDDILLLLKKLSTLRSENLTDAIANGVKNEIHELLARLGEKKTQDNLTDSAETSTNIHLTQNCSIQIDSPENDSIKIEIGLEKKGDQLATESIDNDSPKTELNGNNSVKISSTKNVSITIDSSKKDSIHTGSTQCDIEITQDQSATKLDQKLLPNPECETKSEDDNNNEQQVPPFGVNQYDGNSLEDLTDILSQCSLEETERADSSGSDFLKSLPIENDWNKIDFTKKFLKTKGDQKVFKKKTIDSHLENMDESLEESTIPLTEIKEQSEKDFLKELNSMDINLETDFPIENLEEPVLDMPVTYDLNKHIDDSLEEIKEQSEKESDEYSSINKESSSSDFLNELNSIDINLETDSRIENVEEPVRDMPVTYDLNKYIDDSLEELIQQSEKESDEEGSSSDFLNELNSADINLETDFPIENLEEPVPDMPVTYDLNKHIDDSLEEFIQQSEKESDEEGSSSDFLNELNSTDINLETDSRLENLKEPVPDMPVTYDLNKYIDDSLEEIKHQSEKESDEYSSINEEGSSSDFLNELNSTNINLETDCRLENLKEPIPDMPVTYGPNKHIDDSLEEIKHQSEKESDEYSSINEESSSSDFLNELNSANINLKTDCRLDNMGEPVQDMPVAYDLNKQIYHSIEIPFPLPDIKHQSEKESDENSSIYDESKSENILKEIDSIDVNLETDFRLENLEEPIPDMPVANNLYKYIDECLEEITIPLPEIKQQYERESDEYLSINKESSSTNFLNERNSMDINLEMESRLENLEEHVPDMPVAYDLNKYIEDSLDQITFSLPDMKQQSGEESDELTPTTDEQIDGDIPLVNNWNNNSSFSMDEVFISFESNENKDNSDDEST